MKHFEIALMNPAQLIPIIFIHLITFQSIKRDSLHLSHRRADQASLSIGSHSVFKEAILGHDQIFDQHVVGREFKEHRWFGKLRFRTYLEAEKIGPLLDANVGRPDQSWFSLDGLH